MFNKDVSFYSKFIFFKMKLLEVNIIEMLIVIGIMIVLFLYFFEIFDFFNIRNKFVIYT